MKNKTKMFENQRKKKSTLIKVDLINLNKNRRKTFIKTTIFHLRVDKMQLFLNKNKMKEILQ